MRKSILFGGLFWKWKMSFMTWAGIQLVMFYEYHSNDGIRAAISQFYYNTIVEQYQHRGLRHNNHNLDNSTNVIVVYSGPTSLDRSLGKNELYLKNFDYFLQHGIDCENQDTVLVLTKEVATHYASTIKTIRDSCNTKDNNSKDINSKDNMPLSTSPATKTTNNNEKQQQHSLFVLEREDMCYDMGSFYTVLYQSNNQIDLSLYDYFIYMNCGVVGPYNNGSNSNNKAAALPAKSSTTREDKAKTPAVSSSSSSSSLPWITKFTSLLDDGVKMSGVSVNCQYHPHIQSMAFALDRVGLDIIRNSGAVYDCGMYNSEMTKQDKLDLIQRYEVGMGKAIFNAGYGIASLLGGSPIITNHNHDQHDQQQRQQDGTGVVKNTRIYPYQLLNGDDLTWCEDIWHNKIKWEDAVFYKSSRFIPKSIQTELSYDTSINTEMEQIAELEVRYLTRPCIYGEKKYLEQYPDVKSAIPSKFKYAFGHWRTTGHKEHRQYFCRDRITKLLVQGTRSTDISSFIKMQ